MARVPYREAEELPEDVRDLVVSSLQGRSLHVYRAIANNPAVLEGLRAFLGTLWADTGLTDRQRELVILATARAAGSEYEWHQHTRIARDDHLTVEELDAIGARAFEAFDPDDEALLAYGTAVAEGTVDDALHDAALEVLGDASTVVGAAATSAGYLGLARIIDACGVELEPGDAFVGWTPSERWG